MKPIAIYIHIPYCLYKCHYCDFNSYPTSSVDSLESEYVDTLLKEIEERSQKLVPFTPFSLFFGGGTPSLFSPSSIGRIIQRFLNHQNRTPKIPSPLRGEGLGEGGNNSTGHPPPAPLPSREGGDSIEITLEVNPKTVSRKKIEEFVGEGVNRFSIGVQSFQDRYLTPLGRLHTGQEAIETLKIFNEIGVNFNIDLMFGFPNQTVQEVLHDLQTAVDLEPFHLSFYNLTLEKGTLLTEQERRKEISLPDNEIQAEMYEKGIEFLENSNYSLYEISNFSRSQSQSKHNLAYWRYQDYLGFGAGAVSFVHQDLFLSKAENIYGLRWKNRLTPKEYIDSIQQGFFEREKEKIDFQTAQQEFWMMGLRLKEGVFIQEFRSRFGEDSFSPYLEKINSLISKDWVVYKEDKIWLTEKGRLFTNDVVSELFV